MRVIDPGHYYVLDDLDHEAADWQLKPARLWFVKRIGEKFPGNREPSHSGTTTQEVIRALIDRTQYVDNQRPDPTNQVVIASLRAALVELEVRAAQERGDTASAGRIRALEHPEREVTCAGCGHLFCSRDHQTTTP